MQIFILTIEPFLEAPAQRARHLGDTQYHTLHKKTELFLNLHKFPI